MDALQVGLIIFAVVCFAASFYNLGKAVAWKEADRILKRAMGMDQKE